MSVSDLMDPKKDITSFSGTEPSTSLLAPAAPKTERSSDLFHRNSRISRKLSGRKRLLLKSQRPQEAAATTLAPSALLDFLIEC